MRTGRVLAFSAAAVGLLGLAVLAGLGAPNAPSPAVARVLPAVTLGVVVAAGLADGFNPCAFTVLLLFITSLLAAAQARAVQSAASLRGRVIGLGSIYIASVFFTYLALGIGLLSTADLFTQRHLPARLGAVLAIALGLWMLKDYFVPELGFPLSGLAPAWCPWASPSLRSSDAHGKRERLGSGGRCPGGGEGGFPPLPGQGVFPARAHLRTLRRGRPDFDALD